MRRLVAPIAVLTMAAGACVAPYAATAQDRPPEGPATVQPEGDDRPPPRPDTQQRDTSGTRDADDAATRPADGAENAGKQAQKSVDAGKDVAEGSKPEGSDKDSSKPAGTVGPPAWEALREDEFAYQSCLLGLSMLDVGYEEVGPVTSAEDRDCGIARPLNVTEIQPSVTIAGGAVMRCETARRLALWLRNDALEAVGHLPGAPRIAEILPGSTYQCRARVGGAEDKLSEHALGNAFDVSGFRMTNGTELMVSPRNDTGDVEEAVQKAMRYAACLQFTTVLGPGSNASHDDHLHFDIAARRGGWRLCE